MIRKGLAIWIVCLLSFPIYAQEPVRPEIDLEEFSELLFQVQDDDVNYEDLYESLLQLYTNPINLNRASKEELSTLYLLSVAQINALITHIEQNGSLMSLYELQSVPGFDPATIQKILPFVELGGADDFSSSGSLMNRIFSEKNNYFLLRTDRILETQKGYTPKGDTTDSRFLGSPHRLYGRFRVNHSKDFSLGFTFEKDAGEQLSWNSNRKQYGFDYYSFHFLKENVGKFKKIIVGDYQMQFGQGLLLGAGFNPGKGAETISTVKRNSTGIRPYTSVLESGFMRGFATTYQVNNFEITPFVSQVKQDASIKSDTTFTDFDEYISSIQQTGFHRTDSELSKKGVVSEMTFGANILYRAPSENLKVGFTFINTDYSVPLVKKPNNYNQYEFQGQSNYNLGGFFSYNWQNFIVFGEGARSQSGGLGMVGGFIGSLSPIVSMSMVLRNYQKDFHSFYGNAFGESTRNINEKGIYWGLKVTPSRKFGLSAYYDRFSFPWLKFRSEAPSQGYEYLARVNYSPLRSITLYGQYRAEAKELTVNPDDGNLNRLEQGLKKSYLFNLNFALENGLSLKSRIQFSDYSLAGVKTKGMAISQDVNLKIKRFSFSTRMAIIDTDDFVNRQYLYEKDVLYSFSIKGISGQAIRNYILVQYKPSKKINFWLRYARTTFQDANRIVSSEGSSLGSGLSEIEGNTRSEIKMQVRYRF